MEISGRPFNYSHKMALRKDLLGAEEKAAMIRDMQARVGKGQYNAGLWSRIFKRLPATVLKIAAEAGIALKS